MKRDTNDDLAMNIQNNAMVYKWIISEHKIILIETKIKYNLQ